MRIKSVNTLYNDWYPERKENEEKYLDFSRQNVYQKFSELARVSQASIAQLVEQLIRNQ